ncbi:mg2+ transporter zinc transport protein [Diaporthe eres]|nr:mg2+ transporter zinc transport protein [Diaporthe eres]
MQLLKCASTIPSRDRQNEPSHHLPSQTADASSETTAQTRIQEAVCERPLHQSNPASKELALDSHVHGQRSVVVKKAIPFNNLIDTPKISIMEDEWLYPCPHFFSTARIDITRHINRHILRPWLRRRQEDERPTFPTSKPSSDPFETIIEHVPNKFSPFPWPFPFSSCGKDTNKEWWQRKVLELYLLDCIMREIAESALNILTQVLHALEEDLTSNLGALQKWSSRESDRSQEQPRWTSSRERKYRGAINKYRGSIERRTRDLETRRDTMRKLKENLATNRQKICDDRELRRNENIRYFTYATVIFLPLDFAASFYSMNGIPGNDLLISLVNFAVGAFVVTVVLLASAKRLFLAVDVLTSLRPIPNTPASEHPIIASSYIYV